MRLTLVLNAALLSWITVFVSSASGINDSHLHFEQLPSLPNEIGVAGPFVGIHNDQLIVAGGANFAKPDNPQLWELPKKYLTQTWLLRRQLDGDSNTYDWKNTDDCRLSQAVAYGSAVSTEFGVLCLGGENEKGLTNRAFLLSIDNSRIVENDLAVPDLPLPCTAGGAAILDGFVYLVAGRVKYDDGQVAASRIVWRLRLDHLKNQIENGGDSLDWEKVIGWPDSGPRRMHCQVVVQHDGFRNLLYVIGGRRFLDGSDPSDLLNLQATRDGWAFDPSKYAPNKPNAEQRVGQPPWKKIADCPVPLTAGTAFTVGPAHIVCPSGATMVILHDVVRSGEMMNDFNHPGFPKKSYAYHTITDTWIEFSDTPVNQVTTPAVKWGQNVILVSGEIRPRVRTPNVWMVSVVPKSNHFGWVNGTVVVVYLLLMVGIGVHFMLRNKTTDDYFRGGKNIPWWVAGCSIFATMLSSITYMAIPAKAYAQDWVYFIGSFLILAVAPIAAYIALPFFRQIDATSAYEYLEKRFNRSVRLIGSGAFSLFHIFRMGVVLALAAMALASVTPITPAQCVIVMGVLSIIYCTLGGVEAVVWTDTIQTFVLLIGATVCFAFAWFGASSGSLEAALNNNKFHRINLDWSADSFTVMALWVVILGGFGQNLASYTADQAVVQRYMTTANEKKAVSAIWLNGILAIPASAVFFAMGTAFWMYYQSHPDQLDPTIANDRIMPLFISQQLPVGLAGLVVAGIFAAAQSTVSTSMNSGATTIVTDFMRPFGICKTENGFMWSARLITFSMGIFGTATGLIFIDPLIKSLFDQFIGILGLFLGVLAGLFALGITTRKANGLGGLIGAAVSIALMIGIVLAANNQTIFGTEVRRFFDSLGLSIYRVNGYLYATIGVSVCYIVGYFCSFMFAPEKTDKLNGLTWWTLSRHSK